MPDLPVLPSVFSRLLPTPVPPLEYKTGVLPLFEGFLHNWKLGQLERAAEREAAISEAKLRETRAQFDQVKELLLFGRKYELALQQLRHEQEMLDLNKKTAEARLTRLQLQNIMTQIETQKAQLEFEHMSRELGENDDKPAQAPATLKAA